MGMGVAIAPLLGWTSAVELASGLLVTIRSDLSFDSSSLLFDGIHYLIWLVSSVFQWASKRGLTSLRKRSLCVPAPVL
jgi:hypothetical protein